MKKFLLVLILVLITSLTPITAVQADTDVKACVKEGLKSLLQGSTKHIDINTMAKRVIGPGVRLLSQHTIEVGIETVRKILQEGLRVKIKKYSTSKVINVSVKPSTKSSNGFRANGMINTGKNNYRFQTLGYTVTTGGVTCKFYSLTIEDVFITKNWVRQQSAMREFLKKHSLQD